MTKYFILLTCLATMSCKQVPDACCVESAIEDSVVAISVDEPIQDSAVTRITESLKKSENIEDNIKCIVEDRVTLQVQNTKLSNELKTTKDSLQKVTVELKETKLKLPKKRNLFQRILGVAKDSVEVIQRDTVLTK